MSIGALLGGIVEGFGSQYLQKQEREREEKRRQQEFEARIMLEGLERNVENLTPEQYSMGMGSVMERFGVPKKQVAEIKQQFMQAMPQPEKLPLPTQMSPIPQREGALPEHMMSPMPQMPKTATLSHTFGELEAKRKLVANLEQEKQITEARAQMDEQIAQRNRERIGAALRKPRPGLPQGVQKPTDLTPEILNDIGATPAEIIAFFGKQMVGTHGVMRLERYVDELGQEQRVLFHNTTGETYRNIPGGGLEQFSVPSNWKSMTGRGDQTSLVTDKSGRVREIDKTTKQVVADYGIIGKPQQEQIIRVDAQTPEGAPGIGLLTKDEILRMKREQAAKTKSEKAKGTSLQKPVSEMTQSPQPLVFPKNLSSTEMAEVDQTTAVINESEKLLAELDAVAPKLDNYLKRGKGIELALKAEDPEIRGFATHVMSYSDMLPKVHSFRATGVAKDFRDSIGVQGMVWASPASIRKAIQSLAGTAKTLREAYMHGGLKVDQAGSEPKYELVDPTPVNGRVRIKRDGLGGTITVEQAKRLKLIP